jgi:hypothetical protein
MFEGLVSDVLARVLGKYIENLPKENLNIGVWGGAHSFTNVSACLMLLQETSR